MRTAALTAVLFVAACGGGATAPTTTEPTDVTTDVALPASTPKCDALLTEPRVELAAAPPSQLALGEPGDEPRRVLRYAPPDGTRIGLTIEDASELDAGAGFSKLPMTTVHLVHDISTSGDDRVEHRLVLEDGEVETTARPEVDQSMADALRTNRCASITTRTDARGQSLGTTLAGTDPSGKRLLEPVAELLTVLPEDAIGVGAQWVITTPRDINGVQLDVVTYVELIALDGDRATLAGMIKGEAAAQRIEWGGAALDVSSLLIAKVFELRVDLRTLRLEGWLKGGMKMTANDGSTPVNVWMNSSISLRPE